MFANYSKRKLSLRYSARCAGGITEDQFRKTQESNAFTITGPFERADIMEVRTVMKYFRRISTMMSAFILLAGISVCCLATGSPGPSDLAEIESSIEYPSTKEYLDDYVYAVVEAPGGHSVYAYGSADRQGAVYTVMNGEKVKILAERGECSCVIVLSQKKARWINI